MFSRAIVRPPSRNFARGLTSAGLGAPDYYLALEQHAGYCVALKQCGLELIRLEADERYPDSCFVEDAAVIAGVDARVPILTRPGAFSRRGEVETMRDELSRLFQSVAEIEPPGTLDGGDVCDAGTHFFIGISERTNEDGARQLAEKLTVLGFTSSFVDIRRQAHAQDGPTTITQAHAQDAPATTTQAHAQDAPATTTQAHAQDARATSLLHLKSGLAYLGDNRLVVAEALADREEFRGYDLIRVDPSEEYAANCVEVNGRVLIAAGYPRLEARLRDFGYETIALDMSEFQKMDGGLSCLSVRW